MKRIQGVMLAIVVWGAVVSTYDDKDPSFYNADSDYQSFQPTNILSGQFIRLDDEKKGGSDREVVEDKDGRNVLDKSWVTNDGEGGLAMFFGNKNDDDGSHKSDQEDKFDVEKVETLYEMDATKLIEKSFNLLHGKRNLQSVLSKWKKECLGSKHGSRPSEGSRASEKDSSQEQTKLRKYSPLHNPRPIVLSYQRPSETTKPPQHYRHPRPFHLYRPPMTIYRSRFTSRPYKTGRSYFNPLSTRKYLPPCQIGLSGESRGLMCRVGDNEMCECMPWKCLPTHHSKGVFRCA